LTCIAGLVNDGKVWIAGDSAASNGQNVAIRADTKVFTIGPYVMGFTSSFRMGQLLRYSLKIGEPDTWDVDRFMATTFMDAIRDTLRTGGWIKATESRESGGTFLVGIGGQLYTVQDDFQIGHTFNDYAAVGSGYLAALGSLHTSDGLIADPKERLTAALTAAADHVSGVAAPFVVLSTDAP
jgi:20S proteasome alpha/beta subunit